ncbi:MAG: FecR family protein [Bacteroidota bacterium]
MKKILVSLELINKYLAGNCTDEEVAAIYQWYDSFEDEEDPFDTLNAEQQEALQVAILARFKKSLVQAPITANNKVSGSILKMRYLIAGIAAILLAVFGITLWQRQPNLSTGKETLVSNWLIIKNNSATFHHAALSDGSTVWLSPHSELQYPEKFTGKYRQVKMNGSAFFQVTKDHVHPFIINSRGVVTRVWGTSFRVNAYNGQPVEVSVMTGKVSVQLSGKQSSEVMLLPGQKVVVPPSVSQITKEMERSNSEMRIWQNTSMQFKNAPVDSIISAINKRFKVHIHIADQQLGSYLLKADFTEQNLASILEILESSLNVGYRMNGMDIELYRVSQEN